LLSEMAKTLGYKNLQQTDIDKFYSPKAHGSQSELNYKLQTEFLRVLENTSSLNLTPKEQQEHNNTLNQTGANDAPRG